MKPGVNVEISEGIATITLNRPDTLNAIMIEGSQPFRPTHKQCTNTITLRADYDAFAEALYAIDKRTDVYVTIWQGWFSPPKIECY